MLSLSDYAAHDALGLAELVARREISAEELLQTALRAVEQVNPRLNAVLQTLPDLARAQIGAGLPDGPFTGVPFLIKELGMPVRGVRIDMGSRLAQGFIPNEDAELIKRFRRAGLVLAGTTQTPEFGYNVTTEPRLHGPVHNPWDTARSAGGSSGGSAAAVAAGIVPLAHGNDGGGSIRIPASCNGLVGLKPSRDRIPTGPHSSDPLFGLACQFGLTRSVRDAAALLDCVAGPDAGAPGIAPRPAHPYREEVDNPPPRLRIAWSDRSIADTPIDPECVRAVHDTVSLLEQMGHTLIEDHPRLDWELFLHRVYPLWAVTNTVRAEEVARALERKPGPENLEAATWVFYEDGKRYSAMDLLQSMDHNNVISRAIGRFFEQIDVLVTPTMARPPAPLGEINQDRPGITGIEWTYQVFNYCPFTPLFNITGQPAISLPLHWTPAGVPIGVQFVAHLGEEATLLRLAGALEKAQPWARRRPPLHVAQA
jgi:amidase